MKKLAISVDEAYRGISDWLSCTDYDFSDGGSHAEMVEFNVMMGSYKIPIIFDAKRQLYMFHMLNGRVKSVQSLNELVDAFNAYYKINMELIPKAKKVADYYENILGVKTVFDNFVGGSSRGFTVKFKVLGSDTEGLRIKIEADNTYIVSYVEYDEEDNYTVIRTDNIGFIDGKLKVLSNFTFDSIANDKCELVDNVLTYRDEKNNHLVFKSYGEDILLCSGNIGLRKVTDVVKIQARDLDGMIDEATSADVWSFIDLYESLKSYMIDDNTIKIKNKVYTVSSDANTVIMVDGDENMVKINDADVLRLFLESEEDEEENMQDKYKAADTTANSKQIQEKVEQKTDVKHTDKQKAEEVQESSNNVSTVKLVTNEQGDITFVRFIHSGGIYDVKPSLVEATGLPVKNIINTVKIQAKNGMLLTEDEVRLKMFAKVVDSESKINELVMSLFN